MYLAAADAGGPGERIREADSIVEHFVPVVETILKGELFFDHGKGEEHELGDIGEGVAGTSGNAVLSYGGEELAQDKVDVGGGKEVARDRRTNFGAESLGFEELLFVARVKDAKSRMAGGARQTTTAAIGSFKSTAIGLEGFSSRGVSGRIFKRHFHDVSSQLSIFRIEEEPEARGWRPASICLANNGEQGRYEKRRLLAEQSIIAIR